MKLEEKWKAIELRKKGVSYSKILKTVSVAKSTLSLWLRDVPLDENAQQAALKGREISRCAAGKRQREMRENRVHEGLTRGIKEFPELVNNPLFVSGLCLYWAEGDKHKQERVKFTNSDKNTIALMMRWFREICDVPEEKFRLALHVHDLHVAKDVGQYWAKITGIPENQFQKTYIKHTTLRQRRNVLYNGTCAIVVNDKALFRRICGWKAGLLKHFRISP